MKRDRRTNAEVAEWIRTHPEEFSQKRENRDFRRFRRYQ